MTPHSLGFADAGCHLIAIPFRSLKLVDSSRDIMLPGVSRAALEKTTAGFPRQPVNPPLGTLKPY
ncbi:MAG: hypothetical protein JWR80_5026 [Bradyrhizobium sp.]|nr:hypothetical protein [Bradyrhizobium sp.]